MAKTLIKTAQSNPFLLRTKFHAQNNIYFSQSHRIGPLSILFQTPAKGAICTDTSETLNPYFILFIFYNKKKRSTLALDMKGEKNVKMIQTREKKKKQTNLRL